MGLGMVRRLGLHGDGVVTERTWRGLGDGMDMAQGGRGNGEGSAMGIRMAKGQTGMI